MSQIKILTSPTCHYCHAAKTLLQQQGLDYHEIDLHKEAELAQQLLSRSGQRTVPQIFINEKPIGGFTELSQLMQNREIDSIQPLVV